MSRTNTRIGQEINAKATKPQESAAITHVCKIMTDMLTDSMDNLEYFAKSRQPEQLLKETTDFKSLYHLYAGMCKSRTPLSKSTIPFTT